MRQVWEYMASNNTTQRGLFVKFSDLGGTDITYYFHRLGDDGLVIKYQRDGRHLDCVNGARLKLAHRVGAVANEDTPYKSE